MTIRFYPSRLPGEPLETHEHGVTSIRKWLVANVEGYEDRDVPPLTVEVEGLLIPPGEWAKCVIRPDSDVRLYPVPFGLEAATIAWIGVGISVAAAAYSYFMMSNIDTGGYTSSTGRSLDLNPAKANTAKLGDAIREVFGRVRIYPDYVVQPVTRFDAADPTKMRVQMLLCLGVGDLIYTNGDIRVGSTPASTLPGFSSTHYPPGADVSGDERSENWVNSTEVGGTSSGTGLDMAQTSPDADDIIADSMTVSGSSVTFTGLDTDDDDDNDENDNALPPSWVAGAVVELKAPANYQITTAAGYSVIASPLLTEIAPVKQEIVCSRSFGGRITEYHEMRQAICSYASRAAEKLRGEHQYCRFISVFVKTSPFALNEPYYGNSASVKLLTPTQDSRDIITAATKCLDAIWRDGHRYQKAGVMLGDFYSQGVAQLNLFDDNAPRQNSEKLMEVLDHLNAKNGRGALYFAGQGIQTAWQMKREMLSPRYTTRFCDLLKVR
ncbi:DUF4113 domain-containing protein [Klebsiella pneumoniae]|nr:DUF4113 domain-containing protein [Klebsiella pneumoniae]